MFLHKIILLLTHVVLKIFDTLSWRWNRIKRRICCPTTQDFKPQKLPIHLGIVINEERIALSDVASLIMWCITIGIPQLSIYDYNGKYISACRRHRGQELYCWSLCYCHVRRLEGAHISERQ